MEQHQATCPHMIVSCRYSSVGCKQKIKRGDIQTHNKECMEEHLDNAVGTLEEVLKSTKELKESTEDLKDCIEELEAKDKKKVQYYDSDGYSDPSVEEYKWNTTTSIVMIILFILYYFY